MPKSTSRPALHTLTRVGLAGLATAGILMVAPAGAQAAPMTTVDQATPAVIVPGPTLHLTWAKEQRLERAAAERRREAAERRREARLAASREAQIRKALDVAFQHVGDPYVWGATGPDSFDCSGLTSYAYAAAGIPIPRTAAEQSAYFRTIPRDQLRRGDLVFFDDGAGVYHVGFWLGWGDGSGVILHAPHTGATVRTEAIWTDNWFAGTLRTR
ncbi:C40 family peptidase [Nocardioides sp. KR10-350]|uniref:C40 family peptidase n=1 Tax=Nocardioides cheoyonin TaxID=3156615 RepID=UPI0032B44EF7